MKLDLNKFYNTNYKDFVHKEAVEEALKLVPEVELKDVEVDNILSITFSVDEFGENPMYIEYIDKESKKHLVRIRPAVSNEIQEMLKRYVTLEQHETDKNAIYNYFEHMHVPMEIRSATGLDEDGNESIMLNNDNSYLSFQVDPETDNAIQWLCIQNHNGELGSQSQYFARFVDFAKVDEVPSNADFAEKVRELEEKMNAADNRVLEASKQYTDSTITSLGDELNAKIEQTKNEVTVLIEEKTQDTLQQAKDYADNKDTEYFETSKRYTNNAKQEAINESKTYTNTKSAETLETSKTYTDTKHTEVTQHITELENDMNTNYATKQELYTDVESLCDTDQQNFEILNNRINNKATVYKKNMSNSVLYYFPQINVTTKTDGDIILEGKDETTVKLANLLNDEQLAKLKNLPMGQEIDLNKLNKKTNSHIYDKNIEQTIDFDDGNEVFYDVLDGKITKIAIREKADASQKIVLFDDFAKQEQLNSLNELVQELATNVNGSQIGERTKINFTLTNSPNEVATNPTITKNESYYVKVGSQYIVSVYLTFNVDVSPTSNQKALAFAWVHDIPAENPPLTLTVVMKSNKGKYTTTTEITTGRNRVVFYVPSFPATEIYESTEIAIYGSAITKDLTKESEE